VQEKIGIRNMKNHEKYNDKTFENDIALIRLDRKVQFSQSVYPICLPPKGTDFTDTRAFVVGWGTIYFGGPTSSVLQEVNVRVWDNKQCAKNYGRLNRKVSDNMLCAGDRGKDACQVFVNCSF
jgi:secreted trypsin-like serine protease